MPNNIPRYRPATNETLLSVLKQSLKKYGEKTDDFLPAIIIDYDRQRNRATVAHQIQMEGTSGEFVNRARLTDIPVIVSGGGGYLITFPLRPGDRGWIKASDRDLSLFLQDYQPAPPGSLKIHTFENGVFVPDLMRGFVISEEDENALVIQNTDHSVRISLGDDRVKIVASSVEIQGNVSMTGTLTNNGVPVGSTHRHGSGPVPNG